ncbi:MAG: hypothetical protein FWD45_01505 [Coriobacteriia bacterium]|nr:hypothetical protein [Coriobacteriia bacterium]
MKKVVCSILVAAMLFCSSCAKDANTGDNIQVYDSGITRGEAVQRFYDDYNSLTYESTTTFTDIADVSYAEAVVWAQHSGLLGWVNGTVFNGDERLTRCEFAVMLAGYLQVLYEEFCTVSRDDPAYGNNHVVSLVRELDDYKDIPEWAVESMEFALGTTLLDWWDSSERKPSVRPFDTVSEEEIDDALYRGLIQTLGVLDLLVDILEVDYSGAVFTHFDTGMHVKLGMYTEELTTVTNTTVEDRTSFRVNGISITIINNKVNSISMSQTNPGDWEVNGISLKNSREEIIAILGEPAETMLKGSSMYGSLPRLDTDMYCFDVSGSRTNTREPHVYYLEIEYEEDGSVFRISLKPYPLFTEDGIYVAGYTPKRTIDFHVEGSGNAILHENSPVLLYLDIDYFGSGSISILKDLKEVFSHNGSYSGRLFFFDFDRGRLEVKAAGDWVITGMSMLNWEARYDSCGSGSYAFPVMGFYGNYRVIHEGTGSFEIRFIYNTSEDMPLDDIIIASAEGDFSMDMDLTGIVLAPGFIVISTDGNWGFERLFEYSVVYENQLH